MNNDEMFQMLLNEVKSIKQEMNNRFDKVEAQLHRMEESQQQDVTGTLKLIDKRLNNIVYDLDYINKQAADQNLIINRLQKQMES